MRRMLLLFVSMFVVAGCQEPHAHDAKEPHRLQKKEQIGLDSQFHFSVGKTYDDRYSQIIRGSLRY
ncbi:membrane lipoprotein lipid attachment site-containing protein [Polycladomyces subterraneus]|uniref:membrane lipoprotein lipid attachment site-containing protein n=1 Tax=Polycladomyces subterraneus TaxID=1016997 RepID=UPI00341C4B19